MKLKTSKLKAELKIKIRFRYLGEFKTHVYLFCVSTLSILLFLITYSLELLIDIY